MPLNIDDFEHILVVEGYSDLLFYAEAIEHVGLLGTVFIKQFGGVKDVILALETFLTPELLATKKSIGVIVDADENAAGRIESLSNTLKSVTNRDFDHGKWLPGAPNIGFYVTPDGERAGEIETLVRRAWSNDPANSPADECIAGFMQCMSDNGLTSNSPDKGYIGALLSIVADEDPRLGPGARCKAFSFESPEFAPLLDFLRGFGTA